MNTEDINRLLDNDRLYTGTFSIDTLPKINKTPATLIVNTDPSTKPGEHWVAILVKNEKKGIYFDSYGLPPLSNEINQFLNDFCSNKWKYNTVQIQPYDGVSNTCGNYCVMFCKAMSQGLSFKTFLNIFSNNYNSNDKLVKVLLPTGRGV